MPNVNGAKCFANFMEMFNLRCGVFTTLPVFELTLSICFESMMSLRMICELPEDSGGSFHACDAISGSAIRR